MSDQPKNAASSRILICEDEMIVAKDIARTLGNLGYEVAGVVRTGEDAVQEVEKTRPDLILMDINLAGEIDGVEAAAQIGARMDIPVVYLTGYDEKDVLDRAKKTEPYGYLGKPFGLLELRSTIETALYKHEADKRVKESNERFRLVMEATSDGIWDWDVPAGKTYYSPGYFSMLGVEPGDRANDLTSWLDLIHPEDREQAWRVKQDSVEGKVDSFAVEFRMSHKDGSWRWILCRGKATARDTDGRAVRLVGTHTDITDRKEAAEALAEAEHKYRLLVESSGEAILVAQDGGIKFANFKCTEYSGYSREELLVMPFVELIHPEDRDLVVAYHMRRMRGDTSGLRYQFRIREKSGGLRWMELNSTLISWQGKPAGLCFLADISEKKQAEEKALENERFLSLLFDSIQDGIHVGDTDFNTIMVNKIMERWYTHAMPLVGKKCYQVYHGRNSPCEVCPMQETLETRQPSYRVVPFTGKDSETVGWMDLYSFPIFDPASGELSGVIEYVRDITDQRKAHDALRESETRFRSIFDNAPIMIDGFSPDGDVELWNPELEKRLGWTREEAQKCNILALAYPDPNKCREVKETISLADGVFREYTPVAKDGSLRTQMWANFPLPNGNIISVGIDITDRKKAEDALRESEQKYRLLVENVEEAVFVVQGGMIRFVNRFALEMSGYSEEEVLSKSFPEFIFPDDRERVVGYHMRRLRGEKDVPTRYQFRILGPQGNIIWLETTVVAIAWEGGPAFMSFATDITDRKRAEDLIKTTLKEKEKIEQRLRQSEQRFREIASLVPQLIYEFDLTGKFTFLNEAAAEMTGYSVDDFNAGIHIGKVFVSDDRERMAKNIASIMKGEKSKGNEYHCVRKNGTTFPILAYSSPVIREGEVIGVRGVAVDITERKRAQERIEASLREKEVLLREIHHRVKNNLAVIIGLLELQSRFLGEEVQGIFEQLQDRIRAMATAHEKLYKSGNFATLDVQDYVESLLDHLFASHCGGGGERTLKKDVQKMSLGLDTAIPLGMLLTELVSNCLKHAFPEGKCGEVRVSLRPIGENQYELTVSDNGIGMRPDLDLKDLNSMGLELVDTFVRQLKGEWQISDVDGTEVRLTFQEKRRRYIPT